MSVGSSAAQTRRINVEGTRAVLAAATAAGVERFVHTSSSAAVIDAHRPGRRVAPSGPPALTDPYSTSKAAAEQLVLAAAANGLPAMIVNPVGIYGPSPRGPHSYNALLLAAARGAEAAVVDAEIGWVLAEDAAAGHLLALERGEPGRRYVLCGEVATFGRVLHGFADGSAAGGCRRCRRDRSWGRTRARSPGAPRCTGSSRRCGSTTPEPAGSASGPAASRRASP